MRRPFLDPAPTWFSAPSLAENDEPAIGALPPHVLMFDPDADRATAMMSDLRRKQRPIRVTVVTTRGPPVELPADGADVALISLEDLRFDGLAFGGQLCARFPWIETVFWFDDRTAGPSAAAARNVGVKRVLPRSAAAAWLDAALPSLAMMTRARLAHLQAERSLPPLPAEPDDLEGRTTPLPEAERQFRETYLRSLLARSESHVIAARRAGLPYTTFYSMLKKLGLV